jgi:Single-strand binding protein family
MAYSINKVTLLGNVGKDPEIKTFQNGGKIANFSLATSESWKDKTTGEKKTETEWHNIVIKNDKLVEIVEKYVKKARSSISKGSLKHGNSRPRKASISTQPRLFCTPTTARLSRLTRRCLRPSRQTPPPPNSSPRRSCMNVAGYLLTGMRKYRSRAHSPLILARGLTTDFSGLEERETDFESFNAWPATAPPFVAASQDRPLGRTVQPCPLRPLARRRLPPFHHLHERRSQTRPVRGATRPHVYQSIS